MKPVSPIAHPSGPDVQRRPDEGESVSAGDTPRTKLFVVGATGATGREIVGQAITVGYKVTALVRNADQASLPPQVRKVVGDVLDRDSLEAALTSQEAVVCALGSAATGPFKGMTMLSEGTRNLVTAMKSKGVRRLVCITGVGAGESKGHGPWYYNWIVQPLVLRGVYEDKDRQETIVRGSGLDWTLVRPGVLTNEPARGGGHYRALTDLAGVTAGNIARADVAGFCLRELADSRFRGQAPLLTI